MLQEAVKEKGKHYTAQKKWILLFLTVLDPLSPLPPPVLLEKLILQFESQICLLHNITCYLISCQTMNSK